MAKIDPGEILKRVREKDTGPKENVTFRLPVLLIQEFREKCRKEKVSLVEVVEELLRAFLRS